MTKSEYSMLIHRVSTGYSLNTQRLFKIVDRAVDNVDNVEKG